MRAVDRPASRRLESRELPIQITDETAERRPASRRRGSLRKVLLGLAVAALVLEGGSWLVYELVYERWRDEHVYLALLEPGGNWRLRFELSPGGRTTGHVDGQLVEYRINEAGLRDRSFGQPKPPGALRVAAVGDSVTFGTKVNLEQTYAKQLEVRLRRATPSAEVLNFGVYGYDTYDERVLIEHKVLRYEPDYVLWQYCFNDVQGMGKESPLDTVDNAAQRLSKLIFLVRNAGAVRQVARNERQRRRQPSPASSLPVVDAHDWIVAQFAEAHDDAVAAGSELIYVFVPPEWELRPDAELPAHLGRTFRDRGWRFIDATRFLTDLASKQSPFSDSVHFSAWGHAKFAAFLESQLRRIDPRLRSPQP